MKRLIAWLLRNKRRRLELSVGGKWYLGFTILLGVVAINSGNNVIYLLESLLLSALILSGILSEQALMRVSLERVRGNARAGRPTGDILVIRNRGWLPLYCLELCEWRGEQIETLVFLLVLPGRAEIRLRSRQQLSVRGNHEWDGLAVATSFPFGFARKIRLLPDSGRRIVWATPLAEADLDRRTLERAHRGSLELPPGEIEEIGPADDVSRVHWPSSARTGQLYARPRRPEAENAVAAIDLCAPGPELERRICEAAGRLDRAESLILRDGSRRTEVRGRARAQDALALLPKEVRHA